MNDCVKIRGLCFAIYCAAFCYLTANALFYPAIYLSILYLVGTVATYVYEMSVSLQVLKFKLKLEEKDFANYSKGVRNDDSDFYSDHATLQENSVDI